MTVCLFTIDNEPERFTAVEILKDNDGDQTLADLLYAMTEGEVGAYVNFGGGAGATFTITRVQ